MSFGENLQYLRRRDDLTQEMLAEKMAVSRQTISKWESDGSYPEMDKLLQLCDLFDISMDTLLRGNAEESQTKDTACYDAFMNTFSKRIAFSVGAILAGISLMMFTVAMGLREEFATALFMLVLTISVVVIIASAIQEENFHKRYPIIADFYTQEEKDRFHARFVWFIAGGVGAILFGTVAMILFSSVFPEEEFYELLEGGSFMLIVAGAVTSFVYAGIQDEKYKIWKYNRDNNPTPEAKKQLNLIGTICAVIMVLATAVYVGLGLTQGSWGRSWWLFPVGGLLCGVVSIILNPYKGEE